MDAVFILYLRIECSLGYSFSTILSKYLIIRVQVSFVYVLDCPNANVARTLAPTIIPVEMFCSYELRIGS